MDLLIQHRLEHDLARFLLRERLERQPGVPECGRIERVEILEVPMKAARQSGNRDVERVEVLVRVLGVHFDDERVASAWRTGPHRDALERDAFALNRLDEVHERRRAHHRHGFLGIRAEVHPAQPAPERLLGQDVALSHVGAQSDDGGDVADVPALLEHEDRDDGLVARRPGIDLVRLLPEQLEFFLALARCCFRDLAVLLGVDDENGALQLGADLLQVDAHVVAVAGVIHHHEQDGFLPERLVFRVALAPLLDTQLQVVGVLLGEQRAGRSCSFARLAASGSTGCLTTFW